MHPFSYIFLPIAFVTALCIQPLTDAADHLYSCKVSRISAGNSTRDVLVCVDVLEEMSDPNQIEVIKQQIESAK